MTYISQRQYLVAVEGITGYFMTKTGGNVTADSVKFYAGGQEVPDIVTGLRQVENITVSRAYDSDVDWDFLLALRSSVGKGATTITVAETDGSLNSVGKVTTYTGCVLVSVNEPEYASDSGDPAVLQLEYAVKTVA